MMQEEMLLLIFSNIKNSSEILKTSKRHFSIFLCLWKLGFFFFHLYDSEFLDVSHILICVIAEDLIALYHRFFFSSVITACGCHWGSKMMSAVRELEFWSLWVGHQNQVVNSSFNLHSSPLTAAEEEEGRAGSQRSQVQDPLNASLSMLICSHCLDGWQICKAL